MSNGNWRRQTSNIVSIMGNFRDVLLHAIGVASLSYLFGNREFELPFAGTGRTPTRLVHGRYAGDILLISRPPANEYYGLHPIRFDPPFGFSWSGDYFDPVLPLTAEIQQVCGGAHAIIRFKDSSGGQGIRIYDVSYAPPAVINELEHLWQNREFALDMMLVKEGDYKSELAVLTDECILNQYQLIGSQQYQLADWDFIENRFPIPDAGDVNIKITHSAGMILVRYPIRGVVVRGVVVVPDNPPADPMFYMDKSKYFLPDFPTQEPFGNRHSRLLWYGFNPDPFLWCEPANIYFTGNNIWIKAYELIEGSPRLMKFCLPDGSLHDLYTFPETTHDWDTRFRPRPCDIPAHRRGVDLVRATESSLITEHLKLQILPEPGISIIHISQSKRVAEGRQNAVLWDKGPDRGIFSADDDKLYYYRSLSL